MIVRLGIPASFRRFSAAAVELRAPILISANALRRNGRFRFPPSDLFSGADTALDSAGFVAMTRYGGFPWSVSEYVQLAGSYPWAWWAAMDYCCEPQIAADAIEVRRRQVLTVKMLRECEAEARACGVKLPMPVLQGWRPEDYDRCAEMIGDLPSLIGVGSMCRRNVNGALGLIAVVNRLDIVLPRHVTLHLFGVKGTGVEALRGHPRIASVDSMAWDFAARREKARNGAQYTIEYRSSYMRRWFQDQTARLARPAWGMQMELAV